MAGPGTTQPSSTDAGVPAALLDDDDPALFPKLSDSQLDLLAKQGHVRAITAGEVRRGRSSSVRIASGSLASDGVDTAVLGHTPASA